MLSSDNRPIIQNLLTQSCMGHGKWGGGVGGGICGRKAKRNASLTQHIGDGPVMVSYPGTVEFAPDLNLWIIIQQGPV